MSHKLISAVIAGAMIMILTTGAAYAYFSSYEVRGGSIRLSLQPETVIVEDPTDDSKTIAVSNTAEEGGTSVVVRVGVFGPDGMTVDAGDGWVRSGDYWYYDRVLRPGETTASMLASIREIDPSVDNMATEIIVVHESAPAVYDENNRVIAPDGWSGMPVIRAEEAEDE